jgi:pimeloyl-ACP methyl ester carboxylesterase
MPEVTANGLRFNTQVLRRGDTTGTGAARPKVVMLHGLVMDNLSSWYLTIANPIAQHADVHLYDLRGHGLTEMPAEGYSLDDNVADLDGLLGEWGIDEPVYLFGNSFGCVIALEFARRFPDRVAGLFMIEAHYAAEGWGDTLAESLERVTSGLNDPVVIEYLANLAGRKFTKLHKHTDELLQHTSLIADLHAEPGIPLAGFDAVTAPTLALYGAESDILDRGAALAGAVADGELVVLEDCSHSLLMEAGPRLVERALAWLGADVAEPAPSETAPSEPAPGEEVVVR